MTDHDPEPPQDGNALAWRARRRTRRMVAAAPTVGVTMSLRPRNVIFYDDRVEASIAIAGTEALLQKIAAFTLTAP